MGPRELVRKKIARYRYSSLEDIKTTKCTLFVAPLLRIAADNNIECSLYRLL